MAKPETLVDWLRALVLDPKTPPPIFMAMPLEFLRANGWIKPDTNGWRPTEASRKLLRI